MASDQTPESSRAECKPAKGPADWAVVAARFTPPGIALAVMTGLGVWGLARGSAMGNDEVATRWAALLSLGQLAHLLNTVDAVHGLYYLIMHCWAAAGSSPAALRIPSVAAMALAAGLLATLARRLTASGWSGLFAGLIMAVTPVISFYAQTARSYAMVYALVAGSTMALVHVLSAEASGSATAAGSGTAAGSATAAGQAAKRFPRRWLLYGALVVLGGYLNEMSLLVLPAHAVTVAMTRYGRKTFTHWLVTSVAATLAVAPLILLSVTEHGAVAWIPRPGLTDLRILFQDYFGVNLVPALLVTACAVVAVLQPGGRIRQPAATGTDPAAAPVTSETSWPSLDDAPVVEDATVVEDAPPTVEVLAEDDAATARDAAAAAGDGPAGEEGATGDGAAGAATVRRRAWWARGGISLQSVALPLLVIPAGLLLLESVVTRPLYVDRYVLYGEAGAAMLAGAGAYQVGRWLASAAGRRVLVCVPGLLLCACVFLLQLGPQHRVRTAESRAYDFGGPSAYIGDHARPGDGVLFFGTFFRKARLGYPRDFRNVSDFAMAASPQQAGDFRGTDKPFNVVFPLMLSHPRIWTVGLLPTRQPPGDFRQEGIVLQRVYRVAAEHRFRGIVVILWRRR